MSKTAIPSPAPAGLSIQQNPEGYRYSVEPFLLADWVRTKAGDHILDVGTGCGIIPLLLLSNGAELNITAIEIQRSLFLQAEKNLKTQDPRIKLLEGDFSTIAPTLPVESFDWILSNPPYRKINSGKINPCPEKALARHELTLTLETLVAASAPLLKPGGKIALAYPYGRLQEVMDRLRDHHLNPVRFRQVLGHEQAQPKICLVEAAKSPAVSPPREESFTMYLPDGSYTQTMQDIYASFNYPERSHRLRKK